MKKQYVISNNQMKNIAKMSVKNQKKMGAIILMAIIRIIKGKLGFGLRNNDGSFLFKSKAISSALKTNASGFYDPAFPDQTDLDNKIDAFEDAVNNMSSGAPGAEGLKTEAKMALKFVLDAALAYVNNIAYSDQPNAVAIITGAQMQVINRGSINKPDFSVKQGRGTGEVILTARAAKFDNKYVSGTYEWEYSVDNGTTWIALPVTAVAKTTVSGLEVDVKTLFRNRVGTVKGGTSAWSTPVEIRPQ